MFLSASWKKSSTCLKEYFFLSFDNDALEFLNKGFASYGRSWKDSEGFIAYLHPESHLCLHVL